MYHSSRLGLLKQNTTDWVAHQQQKYTSHSFGGWKFEIKAPALLGSDEGPLLDGGLPTSLIVFSHVGRGRELCGTSFIRAQIPNLRVPSS